KMKFPDAAWSGDHSSTNLELGTPIYEMRFDTKQASLFRISSVKNMVPGEYMLQAESIDKYGNPVKTMKKIVVYDLSSEKPPVNEFIWMTPIKSSVHPGETAKILFGTAASEAKVRVV